MHFYIIVYVAKNNEILGQVKKYGFQRKKETKQFLFAADGRRNMSRKEISSREMSRRNGFHESQRYLLFDG